MAKKLFQFLMLALYVMGTINGIGYSLWIGEWFTAIGVAALSYMAFPKAKEYFIELFIKDE